MQFFNAMSIAVCFAFVFGVGFFTGIAVAGKSLVASAQKRGVPPEKVAEVLGIEL